jgi:hypothetical protein
LKVLSIILLSILKYKYKQLSKYYVLSIKSNPKLHKFDKESMANYLKILGMWAVWHIVIYNIL